MKNQDLSIPSPCTADWRKMTPADGGRFCGDCKKVVRDLSTMRERDARTLLKSADHGELCVRYLYDKHGKVFFAGDASPPLVPASFLQRAKRVALSAAAVAVPLSLAACSPSANDFGSGRTQDELKQQELYESMGGISAPQQPAADAGVDAAPATDGGDAGLQEDGGADATTDAPAEAETPI